MIKKSLAELEKLFKQREYLGALSFRNKLLSELLELKKKKIKITSLNIFQIMTEIINNMEVKS